MAKRSDIGAAPSLGFVEHDHGACRASALAHAQAVCAERGLKLTETRAAVLDILLESHAALGAYEVLRRLGAARGSAPQPPIAYRALEFLVANGLAHRIERLNAYVACARPGADHAAAFMICNGCGAVAEIPGEAAAEGLSQSADALGFDIARAVVEADGSCPACREAGSGPGSGAAAEDDA